MEDQIVRKKKKNHARHRLAAVTASSGPPLRLAWPGGGSDGIGQAATLVSSQQQFSQSSIAAPSLSSSQVSTSNTNTRKVGFSQITKRDDGGRSRKNTTKRRSKSPESIASTISRKVSAIEAARLAKNKSENMAKSCTTMWVDKYAPTSASDLCVAPKKVKEVRHWIESALMNNASSLSQNHPSESNKLLILVGSPGIGKSTTVRILASEMKLTLHEWNDSSVSYNNGGRQPSMNLRDSGQNSLLSIDHQSSLSSFEEFLLSAGAGFRSIICGPTLSSLNSASTKAAGVGRKRNVHEMTSSSSSSSFPFEGKSIIILEELPNLYNMDAQARFRDIMSRHLQQSQVPSILIFSDVCEGKHKPDDLERLISSECLSPPMTQILQCHAVTKSKMKKCLESILKKEGILGGLGILGEELHLQSGGDIRHAIMALQFQKGAAAAICASNNRRGRSNSKGKSESVAAAAAHSSDFRDTKLSTFHALGKLLYAKRKQESTTSASMIAKHKGERPPLDFDPELVMDQSDIGLDGALSFLEYHSPDFFTDVTELSEAFHLYSDSATFLERSFGRNSRDSIFPDGYAASLAGRAVSTNNRHPTPNQFRSFSAPKVFEVIRKRKGNELTMEQLCKRLTLGSQQLSLQANFGTSRSFVIDDLPFMRTILPTEVNIAMENLHSFVQPLSATQATAQAQAEEIMKVAREEQEQILQMDDIVDDDDDDNVGNYKPKADETNILCNALTQEEAEVTVVSQQLPSTISKAQEVPSKCKEIIVIDV